MWRHKQKCNLLATPEVKQDKTEESLSNNKDVMIEKLVEELTAERAEKGEMKSMFMMMMEKIQEMQQQTQEMQMKNNDLVNKVIDVIPKMGNTTNTFSTL